MSADPSKRTLPEHLATLQRERLPREFLTLEDAADWLADLNAAVLKVLALKVHPRRDRDPESS